MKPAASRDGVRSSRLEEWTTDSEESIEATSEQRATIIGEPNRGRRFWGLSRFTFLLNLCVTLLPRRTIHARRAKHCIRRETYSYVTRDCVPNEATRRSANND